MKLANGKLRNRLDESDLRLDIQNQNANTNLHSTSDGAIDHHRSLHFSNFGRFDLCHLRCSSFWQFPSSGCMHNRFHCTSLYLNWQIQAGEEKGRTILANDTASGLMRNLDTFDNNSDSSGSSTANLVGSPI